MSNFDQKGSWEFFQTKILKLGGLFSRTYEMLPECLKFSLFCLRGLLMGIPVNCNRMSEGETSCTCSCTDFGTEENTVPKRLWLNIYEQSLPSLYLLYRTIRTRQSFISLIAHSTYTVHSQNTIYSDYNWLSHLQQN